MHDGWETRRRRGPGHDWCIVRLGAPGQITRVGWDGHLAFQRKFSGEAARWRFCNASRELTDPAELDALPWKEILARTKLRADAVHFYKKELGEREKRLTPGFTSIRMAAWRGCASMAL